MLKEVGMMFSCWSLAPQFLISSFKGPETPNEALKTDISELRLEGILMGMIEVEGRRNPDPHVPYIRPKEWNLGFYAHFSVVLRIHLTTVSWWCVTTMSWQTKHHVARRQISQIQDLSIKEIQRIIHENSNVKTLPPPPPPPTCIRFHL